MSILVFVLQVVGITSAHHFDIQLLGELKDAFVYDALFLGMQWIFWVAMVLNFQIIAVAKHRFIPCCNFYSFVILEDGQFFFAV